MKITSGSTNKLIMNEDKRFAFGENWTDFLKTLNDHQINEAISSLKKY